MTTHIHVHLGRTRDAPGTVVEKRENQAGAIFALVKMADGSFSVWKLAENYNGSAKGGMTKTWRYVERGLTETAARDLFTRRVAGTQK